MLGDYKVMVKLACQKMMTWKDKIKIPECLKTVSSFGFAIEIAKCTHTCQLEVFGIVAASTESRKTDTFSELLFPFGNSKTRLYYNNQ
jgi:hypothetical protein